MDIIAYFLGRTAGINEGGSGGGGTIDLLQYVSNASTIFHSAKSFPSKTVVNLPNATTVYQAFAYWNTPPIPIIEELTVTAPNINVGNMQSCMGQMFTQNNGVEKVTLNMPDGSQYMNSTFSYCGKLQEVVLNFSVANISDYTGAFSNCKELKKIDGVLDFSSATNVNYMFASCSNLEDIKFAPNTLSISISLNGSGKLTIESVQSIIDGLATVGTAQTLTLHKNVKILQSQVDNANEKGWTIAGGTVVTKEEYYG